MMDDKYLNLTKISNSEQKKIRLNILNVINSFCKENNIKFTLAYGTMLGAVRHNGFIPWDDDIDIIMDRANFNSFCEQFNYNRTDKYRLITMRTLRITSY